MKDKEYEIKIESFDVDMLNKQEQTLLANMLRCPSEGIDLDLFMRFSEITKPDIIDKAINAGWLECTGNLIRMNPRIVACVKATGLIQEEGICDAFLDKFAKWLANDETKDVKFLLAFGEKIYDLNFNWFYFAEVLYRIPSVISDFGYLKESIRFREKAFKIFSAIYGSQSLQVTDVLNGLGILWHKQGDIQKTVNFFKQAYEIRKKLLPEEHPLVQDSLLSIAEIYSLEENYDKAEEILVYCYETAKKRVGKHHLQVTILLNNLSALYHQIAKYDLAEQCEKEVYDIWVNEYGKDSTYAAQALYGLGAIYRSWGKYELSEECCFKALDIQQKLDVKQNADKPSRITGNILHHLAALYRDMKKYDLAVSYMKQAYEVKRNVLGDDHPEIVKLADDLRDLKELREQKNEEPEKKNEA